eukprot:6968466-Heterocapsa_arctica.AAC.1
MEYLPAYIQAGDALAAYHWEAFCDDRGSLLKIDGWQHCRLITEVGLQHRHREPQDHLGAEVQ